LGKPSRGVDNEEELNFLGAFMAPVFFGGDDGGWTKFGRHDVMEPHEFQFDPEAGKGPLIQFFTGSDVKFAIIAGL